MSSVEISPIKLLSFVYSYLIEEKQSAAAHRLFDFSHELIEFIPKSREALKEIIEKERDKNSSKNEVFEKVDVSSSKIHHGKNVAKPSQQAQRKNSNNSTANMSVDSDDSDSSDSSSSDDNLMITPKTNNIKQTQKLDSSLSKKPNEDLKTSISSSNKISPNKQVKKEVIKKQTVTVKNNDSNQLKMKNEAKQTLPAKDAFTKTKNTVQTTKNDDSSSDSSSSDSSDEEIKQKLQVNKQTVASKNSLATPSPNLTINKPASKVTGSSVLKKGTVIPKETSTGQSIKNVVESESSSSDSSNGENVVQTKRNSLNVLRKTPSFEEKKSVNGMNEGSNIKADASTSDSSSTDSSDDVPLITNVSKNSEQIKKSPSKPSATNVQASSSSSTSSDDESDEKDLSNKKGSILKKTVLKTPEEIGKDTSSDSSFDDDNKILENCLKQKNKSGVVVHPPEDGSSSTSSDGDSDNDEKKATKIIPSKKVSKITEKKDQIGVKPTTKQEESSSSSSSDEDVKMESTPANIRKIQKQPDSDDSSKDGTEQETPQIISKGPVKRKNLALGSKNAKVPLNEKEQNETGKSNNVPFKRVKTDLSSVDPGLRDNSFKPASKKEFGVKASASFSTVKGNQYKHEKTKKKRGSFAGGTIHVEPRSFKFSGDN